MEIKSTLKNRSGQILNIFYKDVYSVLDLSGNKINAVHAFCFFEDKLVLVYSDKKGAWSLPGGSVEYSESVDDAVIREVREETNMKVLKQKVIGYQSIEEPKGLVFQTRSVCIVEPYGEFVSDPDGDVTKIILIDPKDIKNYFDWGEVGDHILYQALKLKEQLR